MYSRDLTDGVVSGRVPISGILTPIIVPCIITTTAGCVDHKPPPNSGSLPRFADPPIPYMSYHI